jgi:hypothetical protein
LNFRVWTSPGAVRPREKQTRPRWRRIPPEPDGSSAHEESRSRVAPGSRLSDERKEEVRTAPSIFRVRNLPARRHWQVAKALVSWIGANAVPCGFV